MDLAQRERMVSVVSEAFRISEEKWGDIHIKDVVAHLIDNGLAFQSPDNKPLTLEELRQMQGEPVWVHNLEAGKSFWMLAYNDSVSNRLGYLAYSSYGKKWIAYRQKQNS